MNTVSNLKFVKDIIKIERINTITGGIMNDIEIVIKLKNMDNGKSRIHRLSSFLYKYKNNAPKYVSDIADDIVVFLNYIYFTLNSKELKCIEDLTFDIGTNFLEMYSNNRSYHSTIKMDKNLTNFYFFLCEKKLLKYISTSDFNLSVSRNGKKIIESPFKGTYRLYKENSSKPTHNMDLDIMFDFIYAVCEHSPNIALGVYFQFFGGLRISEVISLEYSDLSLKGYFGSQGISLNIQRKDLRPDLKSGFIKKSKKTRNQTVQSFSNLLSNLYKYHIKHFKSYEHNAIFVTPTNGLPMTESTYRNYFNKAKKQFLKALCKSDDITLKSKGFLLQNKKWSTHVGRGVFSNNIASVAKNIAELASCRGDSTYNASLTYVTDNSDVETKIYNLMSDYYTKNFQNKFNDLLER